MSSNRSIRSHSRPADHPSENTRTESAAPKASLAMGTVYLGSTRQRSSSLIIEDDDDGGDDDNDDNDDDGEDGDDNDDDEEDDDGKKD